MQEVRCTKCNKNLGLIDGAYEIKCPRCKYINKGAVRERDGSVEGYKVIRPQDLKPMNTSKESVK